ncbi:MAG: hypothetical protein PHR06_10070 [Candidatus Cloacimonetes bacterium]|nr:hypothetical protein [Candidatus Cloacimonadota bacterium]
MLELSLALVNNEIFQQNQISPTELKDYLSRIEAYRLTFNLRMDIISKTNEINLKNLELVEYNLINCKDIINKIENCKDNNEQNKVRALKNHLIEIIALSENYLNNITQQLTADNKKEESCGE